MDRPGIPTITTARLVLRPFTRAALDAVVPIHADPSFWWYPLRSAMSEDQTVDFLARVIERYDSDGFGVEALVDRESGGLIGWAGLAVPHFLPEILPAVAGGWRLAAPYRRRGVAAEAGGGGGGGGAAAGGGAPRGTGHTSP